MSDIVQTPDREARLPAWARTELRRLRANLEYAQRQIEQMSGEPGEPGSDMLTGPHAQELRPLPSTNLVRFAMPVPEHAIATRDRYYIDVARTERQGPTDSVEVRSSHRLLVLPRGDNAVVVQVRDR